MRIIIISNRIRRVVCIKNDVSHPGRQEVQQGCGLEVSGGILTVLATHCERLSQLEAPRHSDSWDPEGGRQVLG